MPNRLRSKRNNDRLQDDFLQGIPCGDGMELCKYCGRTGFECPSVRSCNCADVPKPMCDPRTTHPPCLSCVKYRKSTASCKLDQLRFSFSRTFFLSVDSYMNLLGWKPDPPLNLNKLQRGSSSKFNQKEEEDEALKYEPIIVSKQNLVHQPCNCSLSTQRSNCAILNKPPVLKRKGLQKSSRYKWLVMIFVTLVALPLLQHIMWRAHMKPISEDSRIVNLYLMTGVLFINMFLVINLIRTFDARQAVKQQFCTLAAFN